MRKFIFLHLLLFKVSALISQSYYVSDEHIDNYYYRCFELNNHIFLSSIYLDELNINNVAERTRITFEIPGIHTVYPMFPIDASSINELIYLVYYRISNQFTYITVQYDKILKQTNVIDSFRITGDIKSFYFTSPIYRENEIISCFSFIKNSIHADKISLVRFTKSGKLIAKAEADRIGNPSTSFLFAHHWINSMVEISHNRFLITGFGPFASITDTLLNRIHIANLNLPNSQTGIDLNLYKPSLLKYDSTTVICVDALPYLGNNFFEQINYRLKYISDSIYLDSFLLQQNIERTQKNNPVGDMGILNNYYVASNEGVENGTLKNTFYSKFSITKCNDLTEIWKKSIGGDYYFRVFDIKYVNEDFIIIVGSIYDYHRNGILNGFYIVLNSNGDVLVSNQNIIALGSQLIISPNPSNGVWQIESENSVNGKFEIQIVDMSGNIYFRKGLPNHQKQWDLDLKLSPGLYMIQFKVDHMLVQSKKLVIY